MVINTPITASVEDKVKFQLGDLIIAIITLKDQLDKAIARVNELEIKYEPKEN